MPGAAKKHLNTREFKQQQEALRSLEKEAQAVSAELEQHQREEAAMQERLQFIQQQAKEAEQFLSQKTELPKASMFNYKTALEEAHSVIENQNKALAEKSILTAQNEKRQAEIGSLQKNVTALNQKVTELEAEKDEERKRSWNDIRQLRDTNQHLLAKMEETERFFRWNTSAAMERNEYERERREEERLKVEEQKRRQQEILEKAQHEREAKERHETELAREKEAQQQEKERERQQQKEKSLERRPRGIGMGR